MPKFLCAVVAGWCFLTIACVQRVLETVPVHNVPPEVPEKYEAMYREIDAEIDRQLPLIPLPWGQKKTATAFGVELSAADSHRGEMLLSEQALREAALSLERLQALGVQSVSLSLRYPVLTRSHPRSAEYREFYRKLAAEIRRRGMAVVVEMGSAYREPELSRIGADDRGLKRETFGAGLREMAEAVVADIRPEFLTLLCEPDAQTRNTGLSFSPEEFAAVIRQAAKALDHPGVRLGAGAGSWVGIDYFKALASIPELDYIDVHIYPVQYGFASDRVLKAAEVARAKGKRVSIGQAWLYKALGRELGRISPVETFSRDAFSFWQPLDGNFIQLVVNLARTVDAEFCSFSGMKYLFAYIEPTADTVRLAAERVITLSDEAAAENIRKGALSPTGERFRELIQR
jgi:hypothetical protein